MPSETTDDGKQAVTVSALGSSAAAAGWSDLDERGGGEI
jgi:hypothetical protein